MGLCRRPLGALVVCKLLQRWWAGALGIAKTGLDTRRPRHHASIAFIALVCYSIVLRADGGPALGASNLFGCPGLLVIEAVVRVLRAKWFCGMVGQDVGASAIGRNGRSACVWACGFYMLLWGHVFPLRLPRARASVMTSLAMCGFGRFISRCH